MLGSSSWPLKVYIGLTSFLNLLKVPIELFVVLVSILLVLAGLIEQGRPRPRRVLYPTGGWLCAQMLWHAMFLMEEPLKASAVVS